MLSVQEALLFKAAQEEKERLDAQSAGGVIGGMTGAVLGTTGGMIPHQVGRGINAIRGHQPNRMKPGFRMAGGLTGLILGGGLGAGTAALMKQENEAAQLLGKIQAKGGLDKYDEQALSDLLGDLYSKPSEFM
jgi:hypothetical protein